MRPGHEIKHIKAHALLLWTLWALVGDRGSLSAPVWGTFFKECARALAFVICGAGEAKERSLERESTGQR
jgi:Na+-transporting NADH:ubiquinone oxidoreductase subunit NqrF